MRRCNAIDLSDPVSDHPLNRSLVSWWLPLPHLKGSNTLFDLVKTGRNHGTLTNGPTWTAGPNGFGAVTFADAGSLYVPKVAEFTASFSWELCVTFTRDSTWRPTHAANFVGIPGNGYSYIALNKDPGNSSVGVGFFAKPGGGGGVASQPPGTVSAGQAIHLVGVYDATGSKSVTGYLNGAGGSAAGMGGSGPVGSGPLYFDRSGVQGYGNVVLATYHKFSQYNRALSADEIATLYEQSQRGYPDLLRRLPTSRWFVGSGGGVSDTIAADSGTYTLTGTAATVATSRRVVAASGSFTLTGSDATIRPRRHTAAGAGSFTLTGTDAAVGVSRRLTSDAGTYTLAGTAADLPVGRRLTAASGSYTLTGTDANIVASTDGGTTLAADSGAYTLTGGAATLRVTRRLTAASGAVSLAGADAGVSVTRRLTAASGSYTVAGTAADLPTGRRIAAGSGSFSLAGAAADIRASTDTAGDTTLYVFNLF